MLKIYHVQGSRSERVIWACEELGLEYQVVPVDFSPNFRQSTEWRAKHPLGKVPVLEDHHLRITESGAMVQYILDRYGHSRLQPTPGSESAAHYQQWCWFAEASFARPLGDMIHHTVLKPKAERIAALVVDARARAQLCLEYVEQHLAQQQQQQLRFLLGNSLTGADIMLGWSLDMAVRVGVLGDPSGQDLTETPATWRYHQALQARPAYKVASGDFCPR